MTIQKQHHHRRGAYTLIELLMVVAVVSILIALSVMAMQGVTTQAQVEATKVTVAKINRLMEQRMLAFDRAFKGSRRQGYILGTLGLLKTNASAKFDYFVSHPDEVPPEIVALARKAAFRFEFPQRMVELTVGGGDADSDGIPDVIFNLLQNAARKNLNDGDPARGLTPNPSPTALQIADEVRMYLWPKHLQHEVAVNTVTGGVTAGASVDGLHSTESAELLYFFLIESGTFGASPVDADSFKSSEIADTDGDGLMEFVDGWGQPLRYYRWPTRLVDPDAPNPFVPNFATVNDPTEVDLTPNDISDAGGAGLRRVTGYERELAEVILKGLPPTPSAIGTSTPRDVLLIDPDDPVGLLYTFLENPKYIALGVNVAGEFNEVNYHTPDTYHAPLIVSAGPDGLLGLREPNDVDGPNGVFGNLAQYAGTNCMVGPIDPNLVAGCVDQLFDNISSRNRRAGGRR
ncbi:MAG: type II secretion system protein [Planctomycetaceae bacterium]|nr:type II secretion system protein [Planctomycetaceae bacterium]